MVRIATAASLEDHAVEETGARGSAAASGNKEKAVADTGRGLMLNMATVDPDHEDEFNRWYNEEHLPDVRRRFPQITSARRYRATDGQNPRYLVVYEYNVASEDELNQLARADNVLRQELWTLYDEAVGSFAQRTRRCFWQIHP